MDKLFWKNQSKWTLIRNEHVLASLKTTARKSRKTLYDVGLPQYFHHVRGGVEYRLLQQSPAHQQSCVW